MTSKMSIEEELMSKHTPRPSAVQHWRIYDYVYPVKELDLPAARPVLVELLGLPRETTFQGQSVALVRRLDMSPEVEILIIETAPVSQLLASPECRERLERDGRVLFDVTRSSNAAPQGGDVWTPALEGAA